MSGGSRWRRPLALFAAVTVGLLAVAIGIELAAKLAGNAWQ
jgi:hypothetical protein